MLCTNKKQKATAMNVQYNVNQGQVVNIKQMKEDIKPEFKTSILNVIRFTAASTR